MASGCIGKLADWRDVNKSLLDKIRYVFSSAFLADLTIVVFDSSNVRREYKAHSLFLSMASSVFEAMIASDFNEKKANTIHISDVGPDIFELLLKYTYGHLIDLSNVFRAWDLFVVADKYLMADLKDFCTDYISENVAPSNACFCFEMAQKFDLEILQQHCLEVIKKNTVDVVNDDSFLETDQLTLETILNQQELNIKEFDLFVAIEKWIRSLVSVRGEGIVHPICSSLIPKFKFLGMTTEEFADGPVRSNLLTKDQILAVFTNLASKNPSIPMPKDFSNEIRIMLHVYGELYFNTLPQSVCDICSDGYYRAITFTVNKTVTITGVRVFTLVGTYGRYEDEIEINLNEEGKSWNKLATYKGDVEYSSLKEVQLPNPYTVATCRRYCMGIWMKKGQHTTVNLNGMKICSGDVEFHFFKHRENFRPPFCPIASILFTAPTVES